MNDSNPRPNEIQARLGEGVLRLASDPRMRPWEEVAASESLLAQHGVLSPRDRVLVWPAGHGGLAMMAARQTAPELVSACDTHYVAAQTCAANLARYGLRDVQLQCGLPTDDCGLYDAVLMCLPKGRATQRLYAAHAHTLLRLGGRLYVAGANNAGAKSAFRELERLFRPEGLLGYKGGHRAAAFVREANKEMPDAFAQPGIAPGSWHSFAWEVAGRRYQARTSAGVFSWERLDLGTRLLLESIAVPPGARVLDLGCGWGAIGVHAARQASQSEITLVDVEALAARAASETLRANGIENARLSLGDGASAAGPGPYDLILSNPPFHQGHGVDRQIAGHLMKEAAQLLAPNGQLVVVANRFLRYERAMDTFLANVRCLAGNGRYHVWAGDAA